MKAFFKWTGIVLGAVIVVMGVIVLVSLVNAGVFNTLEPKVAGACRDVPGNGSAEDIVIDRDTGLAYISAFDRLGAQLREGLTGTISIYDLNRPTDRFEMRDLPEPLGLHPHGISLYKDDNYKRLFVINHAANDQEIIEIFDVRDDGTLSYVEGVTGPYLPAPNGIVAVGPRQFYIANDSRGASAFGQFLDRTFGIGSFPLAYYDGQSFRAVIEDAPSGGGIGANADATQIYFSATSKKSVLIYDRDLSTGDLTLRTEVDVGMGADNIDVAEDGAIWVAGHPNSMALGMHFASGGEDPAPSQVFRIPMSEDGEPLALEEIYTNLGEQISASAVAASYNGQMLIGSITAKKMLICDLP